MPLPSRSTSADLPVVLDAALLLCPFCFRPRRKQDPVVFALVIALLVVQNAFTNYYVTATEECSGDISTINVAACRQNERQPCISQCILSIAVFRCASKQRTLRAYYYSNASQTDCYRHEQGSICVPDKQDHGHYGHQTSGNKLKAVPPRSAEFHACQL
jgi:hypothetical protein